MTLAFVDTSAWLALMMPSDQGHVRAARFYRDIGRGIRLLTTNLVLSESYTWLRYHSTHEHAVRLERTISSAVRTRRLALSWVTPSVHERAWAVFEQYSVPRFSFCDCTSFIAARDEGVDFVFGFDSDFRVMGFLLQPD